MILQRFWGRPQADVAKTPPSPPLFSRDEYRHPFPIKLSVARTDHATAITRKWLPGDAATCRLCPKGSCCANDDDYCVIIVPAVVEDSACSMFNVNSYTAALGRRR